MRDWARRLAAVISRLILRRALARVSKDGHGPDGSRRR
jgi:hypothetical protein